MIFGGRQNRFTRTISKAGTSVMFMDGVVPTFEQARWIGIDVAFHLGVSGKELHILLPHAAFKLQFGLEVKRCRRTYKFSRIWS